MKTKVIVIALCLVMAMAMVCGCGSKKCSNGNCDQKATKTVDGKDYCDKHAALANAINGIDANF